MAKPNPLLKKRPLMPIADGTQSDFVKRMTASNSFLNPAAPGPEANGFQSLAKGKLYQSSAPLKITVDPEDRLPNDYAENKEPYENLIYGVFKQEPQAIATLVESERYADMHTGEFHRILNNQLKMEDKEVKPMESTDSPVEKEIEIYHRLIGWSKRLQKLFFMVQGLLAGLCMLHLYLLLEDSDAEVFVQSYARYTRVIATFFHALVLIALIGALHRTLAERRHCTDYADRHMEQTEIDFDVDRHKRPYFVALVCAACTYYPGYGICYIFTTYNATLGNKMYWNFEFDNAWATALSSSFKSDLKSWRYLCVIREILAILAWLILCSQGYWNIGTMYRFKITKLRQAPVREDRYVPVEVYRHLFFGNPYLPNGVFTTVEQDLGDSDNKEAE